MAVVVFSVLFATAGTARASRALVSTNPRTIAAGRVLYIAHCQACHGVNGVGGQNGGPELVDVGAAAADFMLSTGRMPLNSVTDEPEHHYPPYFNPEQIRELVAYINALPSITHTDIHGPTIPTVLPLCKGDKPHAGCVTLSEGQQLYSLNCASCHQAAGSGGMLSKGDVVPTLKDATLEQVAEAPLVGPKPMPVFSSNQLDDKQLSAIARYVMYLKHPQARGGLTISGFGPVAEGFVGIIVGFGAVLLGTRLIGKRG